MISNVKDPLYKNSVFLMLSSIMGAGTGFIFWVLAARIYPADAVGLSSAMVSAMRLLSLLSMLGLDVALIRYLPENKNKTPLVNSAVFTVCLSSLLLSGIFIFSVDFLTPSLKILKESEFPLFILFTLTLSLSNLIGQGIFVAFRKAEYTFIQSVSSLLRLFVLPLLVSLGALGIFISFGLGIVISFTLALILMFKLIPCKLEFSKAVKNFIGYAFGVYIAGIFEMLPGLLLPIIVLNVLGAKMNAYFFIAWSIMFFTTMIARNTARSLLAEGSHDPTKLRKKLLKVLSLPLLYYF